MTPSLRTTPGGRFALHPVTVAALMSLAGPALAQTAPADAAAGTKETDTSLTRVEVVGARASLERSLTLKRNAAGVQDSISATELGRFPDDNVADSLSHITGVAIRRAPGGEGLSVSVRGLGPGYSLTTLNGRILATDGAGRDFAFDVLPAEILSGADVIKSAQASNTEGAIGGLIALRTARPLDQKGQRGMVRLDADRNQMSRLNGSKLSGVWSNSFAGDTVGVLLGAVVQHRKVRTDMAEYTYFRDYDIDVNGNGQIDANEHKLFTTCCMTFGAIMEDKRRSALSGTLEWKPSAALRSSIDLLATELKSPQVGYRQAYYPDYAEGRWHDVKVNGDGMVTGMAMNDLVPELANITTDRRVRTRLLGWASEWKPSDKLTLNSDLYVSTSRRSSGGNDTYVVADLTAPAAATWAANSDVLPQLSVTLPGGGDLATALAQGKLGNADFGPHYVGLRGDNLKDRVTGLNLGGKLALDARWGGVTWDALNFGISATRRQKSRDTYDNDFTNGSVQYSGSEATSFASLGADVLQRQFTLPHFMPKAGGNVPGSFLAFDVQAYLDALKKLDGKTNPADGTPFDLNKTLPILNPMQSYRVQENTTAAFVQADLSGDNWNADFGLRLVRTRTQAQSATSNILVTYQVDPTVPTSAFIVQYSDPQAVSDSGHYTQALPSANISWQFARNWQLRAGAAKTMARPGVDQLAPTRSDGAAGGIDVITVSGDPRLKPYSARQLDASLEWYYQPRSALTLAVFSKRIRNFVTQVSDRDLDLGTKDDHGQPVLFTVIHPVNGDRASVSGVELGWQHLWDNGFGVRAQYTRNRSRSVVDGQYAGPLENVAPATTSLGLLYERGPWSTNLAWDRTQSTVVANDAAGLGLRSIARPLIWVTAQVSYEITKGFKLSLEGRNLTNSVERTDLEIGYRPPLNYSAYGRSITVGASYAF